MLVWIASYPRSGNTFLRVILREVFGLETYSLYPETKETCPVATSGGEDDDQPSPTRPYDVKRFADRPELHLVKTHNLPFDDRRAIYIIRDGRAAIASYYHYLRDIAGAHPTRTSVIAGLEMFGGWGDHVRAWDPLNRPDTLCLKFERLIDDPIGHLPVISGFLECPPIGNRLPTFEELHATAPKFFRSGRADSSPAHYSPEELCLLEALHGDVLKDFDYPLQSHPDYLPGAALRQVVSQVLRERCELQELAMQQEEDLRRLRAKGSNVASQPDAIADHEDHQPIDERAASSAA